MLSLLFPQDLKFERAEKAEMVKLVYTELADITVGLVAFVWFTIPMVFVGSQPFDYLQISAEGGQAYTSEQVGWLSLTAQ